jgi:hypothetical protein
MARRALSFDTLVVPTLDYVGEVFKCHIDSNAVSTLNKVIEEIPVAVLVLRYTPENDHFAIRVVAMNTFSRSVVKESLVGRKLEECFPNTVGKLLPLIDAVIKSEKNQEASGIVLDEPTISLAPVNTYMRMLAVSTNHIVLSFDEVKEIPSFVEYPIDEQLVEHVVGLLLQPEQSPEQAALSTVVANLLAFTNPVPFVHDTEDSATKAKKVSIDTVVYNLATSNLEDKEHTESFLLSYRYFIQPSTLLSKLILRFISANNTTNQALCQLRVINVLRKWLDKHFYDFASDAIRDKLDRFINVTVKDSAVTKSSATMLAQKVVDKTLEKQDVNNTLALESTSDLLSTSPSNEPMARRGTHTGSNQRAQLAPDEKVGKIMSTFSGLFSPATSPAKPRGSSADEEGALINTMEPEEIAAQISILNQKCFLRVQSHEFYRQAWVGPEKANKAPNITAMIHTFNRLSGWVAATVVTTKDVQKRVSIIKKFIKIAYHCYKQRNFEGMFAIVFSLKQGSISRLQSTWKKVGTFKEWKKVQSVADAGKNCKSYREMVTGIFNTPIAKEKQARDPMVPYFGLYLKDLTFIEEGNRDTFDNGLANYDKMKLVSSAISQIQEFQKCAKYSATPLPHVQDYIMQRAQVINEDDLYEASIACEPIKTANSTSV